MREVEVIIMKKEKTLRSIWRLLPRGKPITQEEREQIKRELYNEGRLLRR